MTKRTQKKRNNDFKKKYNIYENSIRFVTYDYNSNFNELLESSHEISIHKTCINYLMIEVYKYLHELSPQLMTFLLFGKILTTDAIFTYLVWKSTVSVFWSRCSSILCQSVVAKSTHSNKRFFITRNHCVIYISVIFLNLVDVY